MDRRTFLLGSAAIAVLAGFVVSRRLTIADQALAENFEVTKTDAQWRAILSPAAFAVLRQEDTEPPGSSPLLNEHRKGTFNCAGCDLAAYSSATKFDSGTGWPSFWDALPNSIGTNVDTSLMMTRTEVHCRRCGGHFGHIFDDGPPPTGKRHCINGLALTFRPVAA
ncbi:peptide-methionine (R)-S-oxide reductase MsrB [Aminobacter sp. NyZ550]|uniref:peptide-methionine (R)-S-oxide reductase n=2 Tax=Aminobacter TaxID=31988 RepID=A0AAC8YTR3_AMIAI|nr:MULTISPECIES: peptide-methionine (R)-S-oxide reductase MsrB [Aminobacter]AMS44337.1 Methionine-R-sulfoxide reductase [Aminobacter aminovorans]MBA8908449.1 peptide-methionine (R)-S-oxide reductase [Aminobacter ciceronei]MBA9022112.1 peptide-methionine (R)-S-oxide reductase [Aminobacter ciceronei]MBB3708716.1 peptide-methionine (R)-S-oxide reductase [Aminobacter aminovorans]WAX95234.1 peptide-methionine (R)-S-oxide reductase MsrB [Aminobacter sp. NyZ550]